MRTPSLVVKCATGCSPEGCGTRGFYGTVLRRGSQAAGAGRGAGAAGRGYPSHHQGPAAGRCLLRGRLPRRAGLPPARRPGRRQRVAAEADGRLSGRLRQRGGGRRPARRVHQLPDARRGDLEVDRGHQRGRGRALQPGLGRGDRGRAHRGRGGLRGGGQRDPGAHALLRAQVVADPDRPAADATEPGPHGRGGLRHLRGLESSNGDQPTYTCCAHAREHGLPRQRPPGGGHELSARAALVRLFSPEPSAVDLRAGGPEIRTPPPCRAALHRRARAERGTTGRGEGPRHHPAGRAHPDRAAGARAAGRGRRLRAEPHPDAGAQRDPPAGAGSAPGLPRGQAAGAGTGRGHAELHRAGAQGARLRSRDHHPHPRQGRGGGAGRVRARGGAGRARALSRWRRGAAAAGPHRARGAGTGAAADPAAQAAARLLHRLPGAAGLQRAQDRAAGAGRDSRGGRHRLPRLRHPPAVQPGQHDPGLRHERGIRERGGPQLRQAGHLDPGRRRLLALRPHGRGGQRGLQQAGLDRGGAGELLHLGHRPAGESLVRQEPPRRRGEDVDRGHHPEPRGVLDQDREPIPGRRHVEGDQGCDDHRDRRAQGDHRARGVPARAPAAGEAGDRGAAQGGRAGRGAALRGRSRRVHRRQVVHALQRLPVAHPEGEPGSPARRPGGPRGRDLRRLRPLRRGGARRGPVPLVLRGARRPQPGRLVPRPRDGAAPDDRLAPAGVMASRRPVSILIAALGGQGGGVLTEWIVGAAAHAGYPAQATSIPGVAQRTGATTYYVEVFPERPEPGGPEPVFSLYPTPGDVDVIIASELLEAGRTIETDYASPGRTTVIASTHRLFSIAEKSAPGDGVFPREALEAAARALSRRFVGFDGLALARRHQTEVNALLLGALAASEVVPMTAADFEAAIRDGGVAVDRNVRGLKAGVELVAAGPGDGEAPRRDRPWPDVKAERASDLGARGAAFLALAARAEAEFPEPLHAVLFLERVRRVRALDPDVRLTRVFARRLAVWMTYEDAIRVADLKTRRGRFERIRRENAVPEGSVLVVTDYLKPDLDELYGILPAAIGGPIARWAERRWPEGRPTIGQHVRTTTVLGFLRVWLLGRLRALRPSSLRRQREFALMGRWEEAVLAAAPLDESLACEVAELGNVVKGYGEVRRRLSGALARFLDETARPAIEVDRRAGAGFARSTDLIRAGRLRLLSDEKG